MKAGEEKAATEYIVFKNLELFKKLRDISKIEIALLQAQRHMDHADIFISSKQKMHSAGIEQYRQCVKMIEDALAGFEIVRKEYADQQLNKDRQEQREAEKELREQMLLQFGDFMWHCSESDEGDERSLAIGYDENGMPDSVSLEILGRNHSEFKFYPQ